MARNKLQVIVVTLQGKEMNKRENKNKGKKRHKRRTSSESTAKLNGRCKAA